jgi:hypothetical protein
MFPIRNHNLQKGGDKYYKFSLTPFLPDKICDNVNVDPNKYILSGNIRGCAYCFCNNCKLLYCGDCHRVSYCSTNCQKSHRTAHKQSCFKSLHLKERRDGYCFVVTQITIIQEEWAWICNTVKPMILNREVHPDDVYFNTAASEEYGMKLSKDDNILTQSIHTGDLGTFEFALKCGAASTDRIKQIIEKELKGPKGAIFPSNHSKFIRKWLEFGYKITLQQDIEYIIIVDYDYQDMIKQFKMWTHDFGIPAKFVFFPKNIINWFNTSKSDLTTRKNFCKLVYSLGIDPPQPVLALSKTFPLNAQELEEACWIWKNRGNLTGVILNNVMNKDLVQLTLTFISNEFSSNA